MTGVKFELEKLGACPLVSASRFNLHPVSDLKVFSRCLGLRVGGKSSSWTIAFLQKIERQEKNLYIDFNSSPFSPKRSSFNL